MILMLLGISNVGVVTANIAALLAESGEGERLEDFETGIESMATQLDRIEALLSRSRRPARPGPPGPGRTVRPRRDRLRRILRSPRPAQLRDPVARPRDDVAARGCRSCPRKCGPPPGVASLVPLRAMRCRRWRFDGPRTSRERQVTWAIGAALPHEEPRVLPTFERAPSPAADPRQFRSPSPSVRHPPLAPSSAPAARAVSSASS